MRDAKQYKLKNNVSSDDRAAPVLADPLVSPFKSNPDLRKGTLRSDVQSRRRTPQGDAELMTETGSRPQAGTAI